MATLLQTRRAYDHRLRDQVCQNGALALLHELKIPRSTAATWRSRGPRRVVTLEEFGQDRQQLLDRIEKLRRREQILAAVVRLLFALLRTSGFRLSGERLPAGDDKARLLRAIAGAEPVLPLVLILRIVGIAPSRYHAWHRATDGCGLDDRTSCPRTTPSQLTCDEIATIKDMVLDPDLRHMPLSTLSLFAQRAGKVFVSVTTWARLVREHGWRRPRMRVHPAKPTIGVRASRPNEYWHIDVTVLKLLDGTKAYLHAAIDNYSRKVLAWALAARLDPLTTCQVLVAAGQHLSDDQRVPTDACPTVVADSGVENVNDVVDATLGSAKLRRVLAQVEVAYSNSIIEAWWRSLKHQWLYLNTLDTMVHLETLIAFFVEEHNRKMPHSAFTGQTPDEMYLGNANNLPDELAVARGKARERRLAVNRAVRCYRCAPGEFAAAENPQ
jgi:transposase InsO family protein